MKKIIIALVLLASFSFASCDSEFSKNQDIVYRNKYSSTWELKNACMYLFKESTLKNVTVNCYKYVIE